MRSDSARTAEMSCPMNRNDTPSSARSRASSDSTWVRTDWSSDDTGSSSTTSDGSGARARAMPTRCRWPPDSWLGTRSASSGPSPTSSSRCSTRARRSARVPRPATCSGRATLPATVSRGLSDAYGSWNTIRSSPRSSRSRRPRRWVMSVPRYRMVPPAGSSRRTAARARVDLPHPDSPTRPTASPCPTVNDTPSTARIATARPSRQPTWVTTSRSSSSSGVAVTGPAPGAGRGGTPRRGRRTRSAADAGSGSGRRRRPGSGAGTRTR
jgi:hypothetical protein